MASSLSHPDTAAQSVAPPFWARIVVLLAWALVALILICGAMLGPILVTILPLIFAIGVSVITSAHSLLDRNT